MNELKKEQDKAIDLALQASKLIRHIRESPYKIEDKPHGEGPVTEADLIVNEFIVRELSLAFPQDLIVSEEAPVPKDLIQDKRIWFVDPIDGTREFIAKSKEWSIMIGLAVNGRPVMGVVYQPDMDKLYYANEGSGAFLKKENTLKRLKVNTISDITQAILVQSHSHFSKKVDTTTKQLGIQKVILQGSIGLKFCMIAEGNADLYFNLSRHCHLWDVCAPEIILREAGGVIAHDTGEPLSYASIAVGIDEPFMAAADGLKEKVQIFLK